MAVCASCFAQVPAPDIKFNPGLAHCHVFAVNIKEAERLTELFLDGKVSEDELAKLAPQNELRLGDFDGQIGEEIATNKSFDIRPLN